MPHVVHIANTDVEFEFAHPSTLPIQRSWSRHPLCLQLQYLPLLYADKNDFVAVTEYPEDAYLTHLLQTGWWPEGLPRLNLLDRCESLQGLPCLSWGASRQVQIWAEHRGIHYTLPCDWKTICMINSKAFSFRFTTLSEAALLTNEHELCDWMKKTEGPKVIKTCFGLSGVGNRRADGPEATAELLSFCRKEWKQLRPVIGEPWLERILDFSTQWKIDPGRHFECVGATRFDTDALGNYQGTLAGPENLLFRSLENELAEHKQYVQKALKEISALGFSGSIGFDAFLYRHPRNRSTCLYPLVEINGRQTMSLAALLIQKRLCPDLVFNLAFQKNRDALPSLLPGQCHNDQGKLIVFSRSLTGRIISTLPK